MSKPDIYHVRQAYFGDSPWSPDSFAVSGSNDQATFRVPDAALGDVADRTVSAWTAAGSFRAIQSQVGVGLGVSVSGLPVDDDDPEDLEALLVEYSCNYSFYSPITISSNPGEYLIAMMVLARGDLEILTPGGEVVCTTDHWFIAPGGNSFADAQILTDTITSQRYHGSCSGVCALRDVNGGGVPDSQPLSLAVCIYNPFSGTLIVQNFRASFYLRRWVNDLNSYFPDA